MKTVLTGKSSICWFALCTALMVAVSGCSESGQPSSSSETTLTTTDGILTVPVPERIATSRAIDPAGLTLALLVNNVVVDMSSRDSSGRAVGSIEVPAGVGINVSMGWYSGLVQLASITQQLSPLTADRTETFSSGWNYDHDDDNDGFTNFLEIDAGTIATDASSFPTDLPPVIPSVASILQPVVGLWNLGVFSREGDVVALRINASGRADVIDYRGDSFDQQDDCSIISELPLSGVIGNTVDGFLVDATPNSLFPFVAYSDVQLSVENGTITMVLFDDDGDELPSIELTRISNSAFNTLSCSMNTSPPNVDNLDVNGDGVLDSADDFNNDGVVDTLDSAEFFGVDINGDGFINAGDDYNLDGIVDEFDEASFALIETSCIGIRPVADTVYNAVVNDPDLRRLSTLLRAPDVGQFCINFNDPDNGPWTLFAPSDSAFNSYPLSVTTGLVQDHIYANGSVENVSELLIIANSDVGLFTSRNLQLFVGTNTINGFTIIRSIVTGNGTVHIIEGVLD